MRVAANVEFHVRKILHYGHESVEILLFPDLADGKEKLLAVGYESGLPLRLALYVLYAVIDDLQSLPLRIYVFNYIIADIIRNAGDIIGTGGEPFGAEDVFYAVYPFLLFQIVEVMDGEERYYAAASHAER